MKTVEAMKTLMEWDNRGRAVFSVEDLRVIFPERSRKTFSMGLNRLVRQGVLERAARGVYVNPLARSRTHVLEEIAVTLRRGATSYLSLESALGHYSIISQQTIACATVMTTGRKGRFRTPYGTVAFTPYQPVRWRDPGPHGGHRPSTAAGPPAPGAGGPPARRPQPGPRGHGRAARDRGGNGADGMTPGVILRRPLAAPRPRALVPYGFQGVLLVRHRHLDDDAGLQLAAIDDIISRGLWKDWVDLRQAAIDDPSLLDSIERICRAYVRDPYAQRHHFWLNHVRHRRDPDPA